MDAMASAELLWLSYSMYPHPRCLLGTLSGASSTFLILPKASNTLQRREGIRDTARGGRALNRDTAKGGRALNRDTAKGGRVLNRDTAKGGRALNRDTAKGGRALNRDAAKGGRVLNRDTAKGGRALTTNYRQGRDGRISYKVELHDRVKILKAPHMLVQSTEYPNPCRYIQPS